MAARIVDLEAVPTDGTLLFTVGHDGEEREAILTRLTDGSVVAWRNYCQHWTDVRLDTCDGAPMRGSEITCRRHAATFDRESGECTFGPCEGASLNEVGVTVHDGAVYRRNRPSTSGSYGNQRFP
ncbi:Rieske (2Fe-2S) protein [Halapricum hydrolyticum]|uniref:Rieske 2Fe-2S domain-containing protein n=1 Tax=Halapricum hydrolyticum TaxID=2979991 RepID=A0AAE3IEI4_9EURY|nr:Rieske 2Fe-2S domain-containing protein [Halapricum hydrolyticum]MCU4719168.1 Rieske 2Fe-2S domain-containing protein [Halapricum hydrolyticum]MCU4728259.1 Rieske 2Fe-2S domain-containing protein [Halapricum hydrolyticum]